MKKLLLATTFLFLLVSSYAQSTSTISVDRKNSDGTTSNEVMVVSGKEGDAILEKLKNDPSVTNINVNTTESRTTSSTIHTDGDDQITINVDASGDGENKKIKIITKKDGEEEVVEWDGKGEQPEAMKRLLKNSDVNVIMINGEEIEVLSGLGEKSIQVIADADGSNTSKVMIIETDDDNSNITKTISKTISHSIISDDNEDIQVYVDSKGNGQEKKIKIVSRKNGEEEVIEWDGKGEQPEALKKLLENKDIDFMMLDGDNLQLMNGNTSNVYQYSFDNNNNNAVLGVYTEDTVDGVSITSFTDSSAAEKAGLRRGDIITKINDTHIATMQGLVNALSPFNPGEKVSVKYIRNGKEKKAKVKLRASN